MTPCTPRRQGAGSFILSRDLTSWAIRGERPESGQRHGQGQRGLDGRGSEKGRERTRDRAAARAERKSKAVLVPGPLELLACPCLGDAHCGRQKEQASGLGLESWLCHFLVVWSWMGPFKSLSLSFLAYKMGIRIPTAQNFSEAQEASLEPMV